MKTFWFSLAGETFQEIVSTDRLSACIQYIEQKALKPGDFFCMNKEGDYWNAQVYRIVPGSTVATHWSDLVYLPIGDDYQDCTLENTGNTVPMGKYVRKHKKFSGYLISHAVCGCCYSEYLVTEDGICFVDERFLSKKGFLEEVEGNVEDVKQFESCLKFLKLT